MGQPVDGGDIPEDVEFYPITTQHLSFEELTTETEIIRVLRNDLLGFAEAERPASWWRWRWCKTVLIQEFINNLAQQHGGTSVFTG